MSSAPKSSPVSSPNQPAPVTQQLSGKTSDPKKTILETSENSGEFDDSSVGIEPSEWLAHYGVISLFALLF